MYNEGEREGEGMYTDDEGNRFYGNWNKDKKVGDFKVIKRDGSLEDHKYTDDQLMITPVKINN